jgi:hypothetical protein
MTRAPLPKVQHAKESKIMPLLLKLLAGPMSRTKLIEAAKNRKDRNIEIL